MKILSVLKPFELEQTIYVYESGNKIDAIKTPLDKFIPSVFKLSKQYDVKQVELVGPKQYSKGIKNQIEKKEIEQYGSNNLEIIIK